MSKKNKYRIDAKKTNKYAESITNPTVQPDGETEMGVPIPSTDSVEQSKKYGENHEV